MANIFTSDPRCQAHYRFENGALTIDSSPAIGGNGANTLVAYGTPTADLSDYLEGAACVSLDTPTDYFAIPDASLSPNFPLKNGDTNKRITVCIRFKQISQTNAYIWSKYNYTANKRSLALVNSAGTLTVYWGYNGGASGSSLTIGSISNNEWYFCAVVADGETKYIKNYLYKYSTGGWTITTPTPAGILTVNDSDWYVGGVAGTTDYRFNGKIDDVIVHNDCLELIEIQKIQNQTFDVALNVTQVLGQVELQPPSGIKVSQLLAQVEYTAYEEVPYSIESTARLNLYPVHEITVISGTPIIIEGEGILEWESEPLSEVGEIEIIPIELTTTAHLQYISTGISAEEKIPLTSSAIFQYYAVSGFITIAPLQIPSEGIIRYISPQRLTYGVQPALTITSEALFKYAHIGQLAGEEIAPSYQIESTATLYLNHISGLTVVPVSGAIQLQSRATIWYVLEAGISTSVITEPTTLEIDSEPVLMFGGLTETLLRVVTSLGAIEIDSTPIFYLYCADTFQRPLTLPYQFVSYAVLKYQAQASLMFISWNIGEIESDPVLVYFVDDDDGGVIETELSETWAITTQSWHPSMYSNWGFNSYIEIDGQYYGAKADGIYLLEGENDAGNLIRPGVRLFVNLGEHGLKRIRKVLAEKCGVTARLRVTEPVDNTYADFPLRRRIFAGDRRIMGRDFIMDFQDFDELGHLKVTELTMVRDGRKG